MGEEDGFIWEKLTLWGLGSHAQVLMPGRGDGALQLGVRLPLGGAGCKRTSRVWGEAAAAEEEARQNPGRPAQMVSAGNGRRHPCGLTLSKVLDP